MCTCVRDDFSLSPVFIGRFCVGELQGHGSVTQQETSPKHGIKEIPKTYHLYKILVPLVLYINRPIKVGGTALLIVLDLKVLFLRSLVLSVKVKSFLS